MPAPLRLPQPGGCPDPPIFLGASKACGGAVAYGAFPADSAAHATIWKLVGPPDLPEPPTELTVTWEAGRPEAAAARVRCTWPGLHAWAATGGPACQGAHAALIRQPCWARLWCLRELRKALTAAASRMRTRCLQLSFREADFGGARECGSARHRQPAWVAVHSTRRLRFQRGPTLC